MKNIKKVQADNQRVSEQKNEPAIAVFKKNLPMSQQKAVQTLSKLRFDDLERNLNLPPFMISNGHRFVWLRHELKNICLRWLTGGPSDFVVRDGNKFGVATICTPMNNSFGIELLAAPKTVDSQIAKAIKTIDFEIIQSVFTAYGWSVLRKRQQVFLTAEEIKIRVTKFLADTFTGTNLHKVYIKEPFLDNPWEAHRGSIEVIKDPHGFLFVQLDIAEFRGLGEWYYKQTGSSFLSNNQVSLNNLNP